ncbi:uncharacterized protein BX664DRAFT_375148 [Halteromyces radiatus]|uniref:uncharacterized protein n=1 Tax=Halteromyces radiatus TaxID=101107 RepID=UPI00221EA300|nr:uncharacterized protein BX664DRAFT_375148 [Halteromyces radiatus]KAI8084629.1 hypothetical protein BX664DRAFT_375148 [Halteromyces radiatus]
MDILSIFFLFSFHQIIIMVSKSFITIALLVCAVSCAPVKGKSDTTPDNTDGTNDPITTDVDGEANAGIRARQQNSSGGNSVTSGGTNDPVSGLPVAGALTGGLTGNLGGGTGGGLGGALGGVTGGLTGNLGGVTGALAGNANGLGGQLSGDVAGSATG